jgi:uncharacterized protein (DUF1778 family)
MADLAERDVKVERNVKVERIEVRVTASAKALLMAAANARHTTISEFLLTNGVEAAEQIVAVPRVFYASDEGWAAIQQLLDDDENDHQPNKSTVAWLVTALEKT